MATCHDQFTIPNAKASLPRSEKEDAFCYNHRLILLLKYLLLSPTGMETYNLDSLTCQATYHRAVLARGVLSVSLCICLSVNLLPGCLNISLFSHFPPEVVCATLWRIKVQPRRTSSATMFNVFSPVEDKHVQILKSLAQLAEPDITWINVICTRHQRLAFTGEAFALLAAEADVIFETNFRIHRFKTTSRSLEVPGKQIMY